MEAGEEVWFDNRERTITVEHLLACTALAPLFPPVEIDGRLLCDGGFANNLPFDRVFHDRPAVGQLCIAVDLYSATHGRPATLDETVAKGQNLGFAIQARRNAAALRREWESLRAGSGLAVVDPRARCVPRARQPENAQASRLLGTVASRTG